MTTRPRLASRRRGPATDRLPDVIELVIIGVRAGLSPAAAIEAAATRSRCPAGEPDELDRALDSVVLALHRGQRLADALAVLPDRLGPAAASFADSLAAADRYGLPLEPVLDRLSADARTDRRRRAEQRARALPVRLAFPLVACTLPGFVLLAIVPAVLGALSTLRGSTP